jgi:hypothetical protein
LAKKIAVDGDGLSTLSSIMIQMLVLNGESSLGSQGFNPT